MKPSESLQLCRFPGYVEAGCDEAGRGCLAGPVVAAAVILPADFKCPGLTDSKQLNAKERAVLKEIIIKEALAYAIAETSPEEIDQINILNASILAMHRALNQLNPVPEVIIVDGNRFKPWNMVPHECIVKGDSRFLNIAAASVLAKTHRDRLMEEFSAQYPGYGWERNAGYPTIAHRRAIRSLGTTPLHRKTFKLLPDQSADSGALTTRASRFLNTN